MVVDLLRCDSSCGGVDEDCGVTGKTGVTGVLAGLELLLDLGRIHSILPVSEMQRQGMGRKGRSLFNPVRLTQHNSAVLTCRIKQHLRDVRDRICFSFQVRPYDFNRKKWR